MTRGYRGRRRLAALVAGLCGVLAAGGLLLSAGGGPSAARAASAAPADAGTTPLVTFLGDSWTVGVGATGSTGYAPRTAALLGWRYRDLGVGGSGYSVPGPQRSTYGRRVAAAAASGADVIVVQGSLNERHSTLRALRPAALATLARLRAAAPPTTRILVVGAGYNPGTPDATIDGINGAIAAAANRTGLPFVNPAAENWTDPADPELWSDPIHPDDRGHQLIADHLAPLLRALVRH